MKNKTKITEEEYITYLGDSSLIFLNKFEKISNGKISFNFASALLGPLYLAYRKMYLITAIVLLLSMALPFNFASTLLIMLFCGFITDYIYKSKAENDILEIKNSKRNKEAKKELIREAGGVSLLGPTVYIGVILFTLMYITMAYVFMAPIYSM